MRKALAATVTAAALTVTMASPALASNEVRVVIDPLNWEWDGVVKIANDNGAGHAADRTTREPSGATPEMKEKWHIAQSDVYELQPGGGPQQVFTYENTWWDSDIKLVLADNRLHGGDGGEVTVTMRGIVQNAPTGPLYWRQVLTTTTGDVDLKWDWHKENKWNGDHSYYELKIFPDREAPSEPTKDYALMNLHEVQEEGVSPEDCTVARTLMPGDTLTTDGANDVVCVTVSDGDGETEEPIVVDTGDGNDTVLIDGDTDAPVVVDAGRGNDVVVADTDAEVDVRGGEGHDAVVIDEDDTFDGGDGNDETVKVDDEEDN